jgi:archaellum biogenesis ATPase FlaH|tara:strand:+ start:6062 stop:7495 length:1434 start_codon:yes stop_codon:yes gene_type:complete
MQDFNQEIQKLFLEMFLSDAEAFVRCQGIFESENFDQQLRDGAEFISKYVDEYKVMPELDIVNTSCGTTLKDASSIGQEHTDWLLDTFEQFSRHKALERAILKSADLLEKGEYGPVEGLVKEAIQIGLAKDMGTDYFFDPKGRLEGLKDNNGQVSTGWPSIDRKLFGGFNRGELNIWAGGSGAGKSLFLQNMAVNFALEGMNVLYISLELSEALTAMRIDSMLTGVATRDVFKNLDDIEMKVKMMGKKSGKIQIKYMPSGKNANDIRSYVKEWSIKNKCQPDVLLIDYLDLLMPLSIKVSPSDLFVKDKYVSEELRNLAMEMQCVFVTASQLNRAAVEEIEFDHSHISGGLSKIQTADNVIGIFTSRAMKERGRYQIQFMKTRSSSGVGQKVDLEFDVDSLRIRDLAEDEQQSYQSTGSSIVSGIKKQSTVTESSHDAGQETALREPGDGDTIGKISGKAQSSKLREMLQNINVDSD